MADDLPPVVYTERAAALSPCDTYRYTLTRVWDPFAPCVLWVCLNPSKANASEDDPSVRKMVGFARRWGYGSITIVNLFAYRATDPADLKRAGYPIGPETDAHITAVARAADLVVCAWGGHAPRNGLRASAVRRLLAAAGVVAPVCLGRTQSGEPAHPLMPAYDTPREVYSP